MRLGLIVSLLMGALLVGTIVCIAALLRMASENERAAEEAFHTSEGRARC